MSAPTVTPAAAPTLPVRADDVLRSTARFDALAVEKAHGNGDLIEILDVLGVAGPFRFTSPWELEDQDGRRLIHAGGYAAVPFGEQFPPLVEFVQEYLRTNSQLGLPQQSASLWRAALESNLVALLSASCPSHADSRVFFANSGAEAIEGALKVARAARPKATTVINFERAYHGKTQGALALTPNEEYQGLFRPLTPRAKTIPYGDPDALQAALKELGGDAMAVVVEPVQGEGGVITPPAGYLARLGELARAHGVPVIADEVQSGLGRTGSWFASVAAGLEPDIVTLAKPLGGGLVPIGAVIARKKLYRALLKGLTSKRHSNTFGGGSLAVAVGLKSLELLVDGRLDLRARELGARGQARLEAIARGAPDLIDSVRSAGMLFAISLKPVVGFKVPGVSAEDVQTFAAALALRGLHEAGVHGCYSTNAHRTVRLTPALNMPDELFDEMFTRVGRFAADYPRSSTMLQRFPLPRMLRLAKAAFG